MSRKLGSGMSLKQIEKELEQVKKQKKIHSEQIEYHQFEKERCITRMGSLLANKRRLKYGGNTCLNTSKK